jgi:hypothetical protein|tara:strand:- start:3178 stop:3387 length:210 start_codon:yes stop_codon:yes gene_type:complete
VGDIAAGLGILPDDLEAVDSDTDPREGEILPLPTKPLRLTPNEALKEEMAAAETPDEGLAAMKKWVAGQ